MSYFRECPLCGSCLDPGERCDCMEKIHKKEKEYEKLIEPDDTGQLTMKEMMICT